jgi:hypothetical protein
MKLHMRELTITAKEDVPPMNCFDEDEEEFEIHFVDDETMQFQIGREE